MHAGQTLAVVGESGSGKSATALMIPRLIDAARVVGGSVWLGGRRLDTMTEGELRRVRGREIGVVFQEPMSSLNPVMSVGEQVMEALLAHEAVGRAEAKRRTVDALARVGIADAGSCFATFAHQYSGGMRQRVMIAMALICGPRLLIADEPTTALDVTVQAQVLELIRRERDERGMGVLLVTHDMGVVAAHADAVCVMCGGRVLEFGRAKDVLRDPLHPYTVGLLRSSPRAGTRGARLSTVADVMGDAAVRERFEARTGGARAYWADGAGGGWMLKGVGGERWVGVQAGSGGIGGGVGGGNEGGEVPACEIESRGAGVVSR